MKKFWKFFGFAALAAGLAPYKIEKNEETGENTYQSLLMRVTTSPGVEEGEKRRIDVNLGEGALTSKLLDKMENKGEEPHLFSDEISVDYTPAEKDGEEDSAEAEEEIKTIADAMEPVEPAEPEAPAAPEAPEAEAPAPAEEDKTEE